MGDIFIIYKDTIPFPVKISINMSTINLSLNNCIKNYANIIFEPRQYSGENINYSMTQTIYDSSNISTNSYDQIQYGSIYYMVYSFSGYNIMKFVNQANQGIFLGWNKGGNFLNNGINCNVKFLYSWSDAINNISPKIKWTEYSITVYPSYASYCKAYYNSENGIGKIELTDAGQKSGGYYAEGIKSPANIWNNIIGYSGNNYNAKITITSDGILCKDYGYMNIGSPSIFYYPIWRY